MMYQDVVTTRDWPIENSVFMLIELILKEHGIEIQKEKRLEIRRRVTQAFAEGDRVWAADELPALLGKREAERIRKKFLENVNSDYG